MNIARLKPDASRPRAAARAAASPARIEMNTTLSMPSTISSAVSVSERDPGLGVRDPIHSVDSSYCSGLEPPMVSRISPNRSISRP